jgi:tRNA/rRNA methyltransferase
MPRVIAALGQGTTALVFGPETNGLTNDEVSRCHHLINIPTDPDYPALNLSHAVAICLSELWRQWLTAGRPTEVQPPAAFADQERMYEHLRHGLEAVHFLFGEKADTLMHAVRHLIGRAGPTAMEVRVLHGLARQLEWIAERASMSNPQSGRREEPRTE